MLAPNLSAGVIFAIMHASRPMAEYCQSTKVAVA